ncbi:MAG: IS1634 family transposase [Myxococcota bacterium]
MYYTLGKGEGKPVPHPTPFELDTQHIGALPLVHHMLERLRVETTLDRFLPRPHPRTRIPPRQALGVLVRNLALARVPLYALGEWAALRVPTLLGLAGPVGRGLEDDRVGRSLDRLFDADRYALLTELVVHMVREFGVGLEELHNDSTTITLHGQYAAASGRLVRGKPTLRISHGHNKDHRPDLKQLLWILTVSADGAVPVHFKVADGSTEDSTTHRETWETLCRWVGSPRFLYVADSKLCTFENLRHIHREGGWFLTVLPRSRKEDRLFKDWLQQHTPEWEPVAERPSLRRADAAPDVVRTCPSPVPDADGFRLHWYHSTWKEARDAEARSDAIEAAWKGLEALRARLEGPRSRLRSRAGVRRAAEEVLQERGAERWIAYQVTPFEEVAFRQEKRGRPGRNTRWRRQVKTRFRLTWSLRQERVDYDARCDGLFPLLTNVPEKRLSAVELWTAYKSKQPLVEKRHDLLKNVEAATPMYLKSVARIEALLFLHFVALLVHALVEREIRRAMRQRRIESLPLYPEQRACQAPTARRIFELFEPLQRHLLRKDGLIIQRFDPELDERQQLILELLDIPPSTFRNL